MIFPRVRRRLGLEKTRLLYNLKHRALLSKNAKAVREFYLREFPQANVRIGLFHNHTLGPMAYFGELHIREARACGEDPNKDILWITTSKSVNPALQKIFARKMNIRVDDVLFEQISSGGDDWLREQGKYLEDGCHNGVILHPELSPNISLTDAELAYGKSLLKKLGLRESEPFVTVHNKDQGYCLMERGTSKPWDVYRDSDFARLEKSIRYLSERGIQTIRSGHYQQESPLYFSLNLLNREEKAFMDVFIQKAALFSICGTSGISILPYLFKTPVLLHNLIPISEGPPIENGIIIPKLIREKKSGRILSTRELTQRREVIGYKNRGRYKVEWISADCFQDIGLYEIQALKVIDNTEDEILAGVQELIITIKSELKLSREDEELQKGFRSPFAPGRPMRDFIGVVSPSFLRKHPELAGKSPTSENHSIA